MALRHKESGHLDREVYKEMIPLLSQGLEKNTTFTAVYPSQLSKDLVKGHESYYVKDLQSEQLSDNAPGVSHFKESYKTSAKIEDQEVSEDESREENEDLMKSKYQDEISNMDKDDEGLEVINKDEQEEILSPPSNSMTETDREYFSLVKTEDGSSMFYRFNKSKQWSY